MKIIYKSKIIAESDDTLVIEGNYYFPSSSIKADLFENSDTQYTCPWKGEAQYHNLKINGEIVQDAAWSYPNPKESAFDRVAMSNNGNGNFSGFLAFDLSKGIEIVN